MPFCSKCGKNVDNDAKFCPACGNAITRPQAAQQPQQVEPSPQVAQQPQQAEPSPQAAQQPQQVEPNPQAAQQPQQVEPNPQAAQQPQQAEPNPQGAQQPQPNSQAYQNNNQGYAQNPNPSQNFYQNPDGTYVYTGPVNEEGMYVSDVEKNKYLNILSYLGLFLLIPMFCAKGSKYTRFHVNQGLVLFIVNIVYSIAKEIVLAIFRACLFVGVDRVWYVYSAQNGIYSIVELVFNIASLVFLAATIYGIYNAVTGKAKELPIIGKIRILK